MEQGIPEFSKTQEVAEESADPIIPLKAHSACAEVHEKLEQRVKHLEKDNLALMSEVSELRRGVQQAAMPEPEPAKMQNEEELTDEVEVIEVREANVGSEEIVTDFDDVEIIQVRLADGPRNDPRPPIVGMFRRIGGQMLYVDWQSALSQTGNKFVCRFEGCTVSQEDKRTMQQHVLTAHHSEQLAHCLQCDFTTQSRSKLNRHRNDVHDDNQ